MLSHLTIFAFVDVIYPSMAKVLGLPTDQPDDSLGRFIGRLGRLGDLLFYTLRVPQNPIVDKSTL